ncbi:MAG TPA: metallophosphoesterase family protein [Gemmatimonadales bacterium]|nr:metallophosphoesterase family protein [Gemmatimonadales bacterium]
MRIGRRRFIAGLGAAGAALGADAFGFEAHRVMVSRHDVLIPGLAGAFDGLRIAQVSDVHLPGNQLAARAALHHLQLERPEIVVLNGDMTETAQALRQVRDFAGAARGSLATVAVLGNWEYRAGVEGARARQVYQEAGVDLLINQSKLVEIGDSSLALVGLDDMLAGRPDLAAARAGLASTGVEIWVIHEPQFADQVPDNAPQPAMLLTGHTHGGQVRIPFLPPLKPSGAGRFLEGWYRDTPAPMYVSRGVGTTGIPARFRCPAELPIFTLRKR